LFIRADTLFRSTKDPSQKGCWRTTRQDFQIRFASIAISLAYVAPDSIFTFIKNPVLWAEANQMTADSIRILLRTNKSTAFIWSPTPSSFPRILFQNTTKIKGRKMTAVFDGKNIHHVVVVVTGKYLLCHGEKKETVDSVTTKSQTTMV